MSLFTLVCLVIWVSLLLLAFSVRQLTKQRPCCYCDHTYRLGGLGAHWNSAYCQAAQAKLDPFDKLARMMAFSEERFHVW